MAVEDLSTIHDELIRVSKPGRYIGGEYGICRPKQKPMLTVCIAFPDMYEIGMSNTGIRILYDIANSMEKVTCERAFAPDRDFEAVLRNGSIPLYSLESYTPVASFDILAFSIGYELTATNVLNMLELSNIPIRKDRRSDAHPVVIAGGPAVTNPLPFGPFFDAVLVGEGEGEFEEILKQGVQAEGRDNIIRILRTREGWWYTGKKELTTSRVWEGFGRIKRRYTYYPVPNIKSAQDHGVIEIMRGCPQGCRFCHAGFFYRPCREKSIEDIVCEAEDLVYTFGYREITLSSLSSGDYSGMWTLLRTLNTRFAGEKVSFSLPSLRIESFTLQNLQELSVVRKSGLTFAVETPGEFEQKVLNKTVGLEKIIQILREAKAFGWKQAKFYFMIGLPLPPQDQPEEELIIEYISEILRAVRMKLHINLGTFVPKPHTPFQWSSQLDPEEAFQKMMMIKKQLSKKNCKVSFHHPFLSFLEGMISRGDADTADIIEKAYRGGARFDAWDDMFKRDVWEELLANDPGMDKKHILKERQNAESLPWERITLGISKKYLMREFEKSRRGEITGICEEQCSNPCGRCDADVQVLRRRKGKAEPAAENTGVPQKKAVQVLFQFVKKGPAVYLSHLNVMTIFERSFMRAGVRMSYTEGFNPKPKIEFAQPLTLGIESEAEIASVYVENDSPFSRLDIINKALPEGFTVLRAQIIPLSTKKKRSLMSMYFGASYKICAGRKDLEQIEIKLQEYRARMGGIKELLWDRESSTVQFTLEQGEHGEGNIKRIGAFCIEGGDFVDFLAKYKIIRTGMYACGGEENSNDYFPADYFSVLTGLS